MQEKNEIINVELETVDRISIPEGYKAIPITDLSSLGLAGDSLHKLIDSIKIPGGEGIYKVTFPEGLTGTLSKFKNEDAYLGAIINDGQMGQARLRQIVFDPAQMFLAFALLRIQQKLVKIEELQHEILDYMYAKERSELAGCFSILNELIEDYKLNSENKRFIDQAIIKVGNIKDKSKCSEVLHLEQINKILSKLDSLHLYSETNQKINELRYNLHNYHIACYLYNYATYFEMILRHIFDDDNLEITKRRIIDKTEQYNQVYVKCKDWISNKLDSAIGHIISPILRETDNAYANILKNAPFGIGKAYSNDSENYISKEEQLERLENDAECGTSDFLESIDEIKLLNNNAIDIYIDSECIYVLDDKERE